MRIFISDSVNFGNHAEIIKDAISIGYGSDISNDIEIISSNLQTTINAIEEDTEMIVH